MSGFGTTPLSTTTLGSNQFPVSAVYVPGTSGGNLTAVQGGPATTDGNGNSSAPLAVYQATGSNLHVVVDSGAITDSGTVTANQGGTWNIANVSGTVSLPTGAATSAKQPALGTAGSASSDVLTVQGITSMTPLKVDGSGVTQPVSGTFWQSTQPVSVSTLIAQAGEVALYGSNPTALTANTDAAIKWGASGTTAVNHILIANNTTINVNYRLDAATTAGSDSLAPGQKMTFDIAGTLAVHLQANGTPNIGGSSSGNIVVTGWL